MKKHFLHGSVWWDGIGVDFDAAATFHYSHILENMRIDDWGDYGD